MAPNALMMVAAGMVSGFMFGWITAWFAGAFRDMRKGKGGIPGEYDAPIR